MNKYFMLNQSLRFIVLFSFVLFFSKCTKPDTEGVIKIVKASDNQPLAGATVKIYVDGDNESGFFLCDFDLVTEQTYVTDATGTINECFKHPALISIDATYQDQFISLTGEGKLNLMEHETSTVTVKMN